MDHTFGVVSKNSSPNPRSCILSPVFSSGSFIVLHFTVGSIIPSELAFVGGLRCVSTFIFFTYEHPIVSAPSVEKTDLSPVNSSALLSKIS